MIENLSRYERQHAESVAAHAAALDKQKGIDGRLKDIAERMSTITRRRVDGQVDEKETQEYVALQGDSQLLATMLTKAKGETKLAGETVHAAYVAFSDAQNSQTMLENQAKYEALLAKTKEIEVVFCRAIRLTALAGQAINHHVLGQSFRVSEALDRAIRMNVIPPETP
jgi:hypothetical protein